MSSRGFTLLELMISTAIGAVILGGAMFAGVEMQRQASFEEQTMMTQETGNGIRDYLQPLVENAGSGFGNARVTIGSTPGGAADQRYAIQVKTDPTDADFAGDGTYEAGSGQFSPSDSVQFIFGDTQQIVGVAPCSGYSTSLVGTSLCTSIVPPASMVGQPIVIFHPDLPISCVYTVTGLPGGPALTVTPGHPTGTGAYSSPPGGDPCLDQNQPLFKKNNGTMAIVAKALALRVNWKSGAPVLEYDGDGDLGPLGWTTLSRNVERLKVTAGVADLTDPQVLRWFPGVAAINGGTDLPAVDLCDTTAGCAVPGGTDASDSGTLLDALMRRLRTLQFQVVTRSTRVDARQVRKAGASFEVDPDGNVRDGRRRRSFTFQLSTRNFQYEGLHPELNLGPAVN
jgi:type IV pilus assembly protein PilW